MNVVFLSPHFPPNFYPFCVRLRERGANVLGLADERYEALRPELQSSLTEYYRVGSMEHYDELLRALGHFTARHGKLNRLDSLSEYWLPYEARLREDFNIPGLRPVHLDRARRKSRMKEVFAKAGIASPHGRLCLDAETARGFVHDVGYPVVAKPDIGVGAAGTHKLTNPAELEAFLAGGPRTDYLLEQFVDGTIVTYDGLVDRDGRVVFESSLRYSRGVMEVVNDGSDLWYVSERDIPADLRRAGQALVAAFDLRERFFHFEFFRLPDGGLIALEVNLRPPGGLTVDMWNYQNEADVFGGWASLLVAGTCDIPNARPWFCAYVGRKRHAAYAVRHEDVICRLGGLLVHHQRIDDIFSEAIGNYGYILRAADMETIEGAAAFIQRRA
jgi:hypothetical protein